MNRTVARKTRCPTDRRSTSHFMTMKALIRALMDLKRIRPPTRPMKKRLSRRCTPWSNTQACQMKKNRMRSKKKSMLIHQFTSTAFQYRTLPVQVRRCSSPRIGRALKIQNRSSRPESPAQTETRLNGPRPPTSHAQALSLRVLSKTSGSVQVQSCLVTHRKALKQLLIRDKSQDRTTRRLAQWTPLAKLQGFIHFRTSMSLWSTKSSHQTVERSSLNRLLRSTAWTLTSAPSN